MQAEIILEHGQAKLATAVYLKPGAPSKMIINIRDEDLEPSRDWYVLGDNAIPTKVDSAPDARLSPMQERFNQILGPLASQRPGASIGDDHQTLMEAYEQGLRKQPLV